MSKAEAHVSIEGAWNRVADTPHNSLPPELEESIATEVASGDFRSAEELIQEAVRQFRDRETRLARLKADIDIGLNQLERGEITNIPDERSQADFFDDLKAALWGRAV